MKEWITGRNPVYEVVQARRRHLFNLLIAEDATLKGRLLEIVGLASERKLAIERVPRSQLDNIGENHQGVALKVSAYPYSTLEEILFRAEKRQESLFVLILDVLQNPQTLRTLLRTAETVGVHGILLPKRRSAGVTPAVVHASAGASEHLLVAQYNLAQSIRRLKEASAWIIGLESEPGARSVEDVPLDGPLALVVGSEGTGMRALVRRSCDFLVHLPMPGRVESLNAAVAGSIVLYLALQARLKKIANL